MSQKVTALRRRYSSERVLLQMMLTVVNNLSNFIFSLIRAIDLILLGFGTVQVGLSLQSHDPSQRANEFLTLAGVLSLPLRKKFWI